jgi:hypothetical protein
LEVHVVMDNGKFLSYYKNKIRKRKRVYPMAIYSGQLEQLQFNPQPDAKESLSQFLRSLGAGSRLGYSLVNMLDDEPIDED